MNRRKFIQLAELGIGISFIFLWNKMTSVNKQNSQKRNQILPFNRHKEVSFYEDFIIVNQGDETTVFDAHCTHLGCTLNKIENGVIVCPCHGSQFNLDGQAVKGPAFKPLERIPAKISSDGTHINIIT